MSQPKNRKEFRDYILQRLGEPILRVNVTEDQLQSRIDDAFYIYRTYNPNATEETWVKHTITSEDVSNGYVKIAENIREVMEIKSGNGSSSNGIANFSDANFHTAYNDLWDISNGDIVQYYSARQNIELYNSIFNTSNSIKFNYNKLTNNLSITGMKENDKVAIKGYRDVNPEEFGEMWNDTWLKDYVTTLVQYQWGFNLSKYSNVALIGGVTVNGQDLMNQAQNNKDKLDDEIKNTQEPLMLEIA